MRATGLAVLLSMLFSLVPMHGMGVSLSTVLIELNSDLRQAKQEAQNWKGISLRVQKQVDDLSSKVVRLNEDLLASRISQEQALQQAMQLSIDLKAVRTELSDSKKLSSAQATEISALKLDRDEWKGKSEWQGKLLRYAPWVALALGGGGYLVGRLTR